MSMVYETREHLDAIVDTIEKQENLSLLNDSIEFLKPNKNYFFSHGIEIVADLMGLELICEKRDLSGDWTHEYSFFYRGIQFFQLSYFPLREGD